MFEVQAEAYDRHVGRYGAHLAAGLCDFAGVEAGMRTLDVGAGPGTLTAELVRRVGVANVVAVEPSESFAHACRARLPGVEVVQAGAEALPLANGTFDAVLSQLVLNFVPDARAAVREMARVARAGGVVAACVWDYGDDMQVLRAFWDAAREVSPEAAALDEAGMPFCREGELGALFEETGLLHVRSAPLRVRARYAGFDDLWSPFPAGVAPSGEFAAALDDERRAVLRDALRSRLGAGDEPFELTARAWAAAGVVP